MRCVVASETHEICREFNNIGDARVFAQEILGRPYTKGVPHITELGIWTYKMFLAHKDGIDVLSDGRYVCPEEYMYAPGYDPWSLEARCF